MSVSTVDIATRYLGLTLRSPIVAAASPVTGDVDQAKRLAAEGVGALVLPSLFEEEIVAEEVGLAAALEAGSEQFNEAGTYFPTLQGVTTVADRYLTNLERIRAAVDVPVIASLNATSVGAWCRYAVLVADAGADAIELNLYRVAANPRLDGADVESAELALVTEVCGAATVPVAVKLSPFYSAMANFAHKVTRAGIAGLVLFNRFYQPDIDLEAMDVVPRIALSTPVELGLPLRWIAILRPQLPPELSLAATSGVRTGEDVAKALAVGADVVMLASELLRAGIRRVAGVEQELRSWLADRDYSSAAQLRGSLSPVSAEDGEAFERANYMRTLRSWAAVPQ